MADLEPLRPQDGFADDDPVELETRVDPIDEDDDEGSSDARSTASGPAQGRSWPRLARAGRRSGERTRGHKAFLMTAAMLASLVLGVVAGATGRDPVQVPGPTVTATQTVERAAPSRTATQVVVVDGGNGATAVRIDVVEPRPRAGNFVVGDDVPHGDYWGIPFHEGQPCHYQVIGIDNGLQIILEEVWSDGPVEVTLTEQHARFITYGCVWSPRF